MMLKSWSSLEEVPFFRSPVKFQGHKGQMSLFLSELSVSRLSLQFEFTNGFEMIYKAWSSIEEYSIVFQGHPTNFKVTQDSKSPIWPKLSVSWL